MAKNEIKVYTVVDATGAKTGIALTEKELAKLAPAAEKAAVGSTKHLQGLAQSLPGVGGAISSLTSKMGEAGHVSTDLGSSFGGMGAKVAGGVAVAGVAMTEFAFKGAEKFGDLTLSVEKFKEVSGTTAETASKWVAVSTDYGVSADAVAGSIGKLGKALGNNSQALEKYGVSAVKASDGSIDLEATTLKVIDAYNQQTDATQKDALAAAAFGKGYQALIPLLDVGSQTITDAFGKVHGAEIFDDKKLEQGKEFRKSMDEIKKSVSDLQMTMGQQLIPTIETFSKFASVASEATQFLTNNTGWLGKEMYGMLNPIDMVGRGWDDLSKKVHSAANEMANADQQTPFERWAVKELHFLPSFAGDAQVVVAGVHQAIDATEAYADSQRRVDDNMARLQADNKATSLGLEDYKNTTLEMTAATQNLIGSYQAEQTALHNLQTAQAGDVDAALASQRADLQAADAIDKYTKSLGDSKLTAREHAQSFLDVEDQINQTSKSYADYVVNQAKGSGQILSAADEAKLHNEAQITSLEKERDTVKEGSPLWLAIQGWIDHLNSIPTSVYTTVDTSVSGNAAGQSRNKGFASGTLFAPGGLSLVGEQGPELVNLPRGSVVHTAADTRQLLRAPHGAMGGTGGGNSYTIVQHIAAGADPVAVGQAAVEAIKAYERSSGAGWRN